MAGSLLRYATLAVPLSAASIVVGCGHPNPPAAQLPSASPVGVELKAVTGVQRTDLPQQCAITSTPATVRPRPYRRNGHQDLRHRR